LALDIELAAIQIQCYNTPSDACYIGVIKIERSRIQKDNILKNAYWLFKQKGYTNTTTREIADVCGIKRGLLHYYYKQKEDILSDLYTDMLEGMRTYLEEEAKPEVGGLAYIALFNNFFFKVVSSFRFLHNLLYDVLDSKSLKRIKIENTMRLYQKVYEDFKIPVTDQALFIATAVAVGSEAELLLNAFDGNLQVSFEALARIINRAEFSMLDVKADSLTEMLDAAEKAVENLSPDDFAAYFKNVYAWSCDAGD